MVLARSTDLVPYLSQLFLRNILQWLLWQEKLLKVYKMMGAPYPYNFPSQLNSVSNLIMNAQGNSQRKTCRISVQMSIEIYKKKREFLSLWSICTQNRKAKKRESHPDKHTLILFTSLDLNWLNSNTRSLLIIQLPLYVSKFQTKNGCHVILANGLKESSLCSSCSSSFGMAIGGRAWEIGRDKMRKRGRKRPLVPPHHHCHPHHHHHHFLFSSSPSEKNLITYAT